MLYKFLTVLSIFSASITFAVDLPKTGEKRERPADADIVSEQPPAKKNPYALHKACKEGNIEEVKALLMTEDINKEVPILVAFLYGQDHVVDILLLDENIDINTSNKNGDSLLHFACRLACRYSLKERAVKFIEKLMARPLRIFMNACNKKHETPLYVACATNNLSVVKELLKHPRTDVNFCDLNLQGPLHVACLIENSEEVVEELLKRPELNLEACCQHVRCEKLGKQTPYFHISASERIDFFNALHLACEKGNEKVVKLLLETNKININEKTKKFRETPLNIAINNCQLSIVKLLLQEKTINIYATNNPLDKIIISKKIDGDDEVIIQAFVDYHWSKIKCDDKMRLIKFCLKCKKIDLIDLILQKNKESQAVKENFRMNEGDLFSYLCYDPQITISDIFNKLNVDVNILDYNGKSALHYAVMSYNIETTKILIDNNADFNSKNGKGLTPLDMVLNSYSSFLNVNEKENIKNLVKYLLNKGAVYSERFNENENENTKDLLEEIKTKI